MKNIIIYEKFRQNIERWLPKTVFVWTHLRCWNLRCWLSTHGVPRDRTCYAFRADHDHLPERLWYQVHHWLFRGACYPDGIVCKKPKRSQKIHPPLLDRRNHYLGYSRATCTTNSKPRKCSWNTPRMISPTI